MACHVIGAIVYCVSTLYRIIQPHYRERKTECAVYSSLGVLTLHVIYVTRYTRMLRVCSPKWNAYSVQIFIFSAHIVAIIGNVCTRQLKAQYVTLT